jgi:hypothetical protein
LEVAFLEMADETHADSGERPTVLLPLTRVMAYSLSTPNMAVSMTLLTALLPVCSQEVLAVATGERAIDVVARCQKAFGLLAQMTESVSRSAACARRGIAVLSFLFSHK